MKRTEPRTRDRTPLVRRFVLVLGLVLVLDSGHAGYWSSGVLEYCASSECGLPV